MKYCLALLLNLLYVLAYEMNLNSLGVFLGAAIIIMGIYFDSKGRQSTTSILVELMCITMPFAWRSIFGGSFEDFPLCWYYLVCLFLTVNLMLNRIIFYKKMPKKEMWILIFSSILILLSIIPILTSSNKGDAFSEFLTYLIIYVLCIFSVLNEGILKEKEYQSIIRTFVLVVAYCCIGIVIQFLLSLFGIEFLKTEIFGSNLQRSSFSFMFEDISSATIFLGCGGLISYLYGKTLFKFPYLITGIIIIGIATTSTRTGMYALIICLGLYSVIQPDLKGRMWKILSVVIAVISVLFIYSIVRPNMNANSNYLYDNGRNLLVLKSIEVFIQNPLIGIGFDMGEYMEVSSVIVHNFFLRLLNMTGLIYTAFFFLIYFLNLIVAINKKLYELGWVLVLSFIGAMVIPNLVGARYVVLIFVCILLTSKTLRHNKLD